MHTAIRWTRPLLFGALLCVLPTMLAAQVLVGRVIEAEGSQPIRHATIELLDDRAQVVTRVTVDSLGVFRIRSWNPGKYRLKTTAIGFATVSSELLELATGDVLDLTVRMAPKAVPLEPIVVKARARATLAEVAMMGYYDRRDAGTRMGLGRFIDRGEIARRGKRLTEVLATIPGVRVLRVQGCPVPLVTMAGNNASRMEEMEADRFRIPTPGDACKTASVCRANIYIDGVQMAFDESTSVDQTLPMEWIEAIEVYRRASEIPAEFLSRATCGVVAIWTRRG